MTEKKDSERLNELLSVFGKDEYNELIEILYRDQIRYHNEQTAEQKELIDYKISAERKDKEANIMSWGVSFWLVIIIVFVFLLAVRACS
ncbi:hypothetical protein LNJ40_09695 [Tenacibaculum dicentrarchi]|nr:hypothetical protein [Tenacibaculum dicentrarchi]